MIDLMPTDAKRKLREIRILKAFIIFAFVLSLLILYIEYHNHAHISWKFVFIASLCAIYDFDLNNKIKDLKVEIKSN
ncbi:hypothetical protein BE1S18E01_13030 [Acinetobacter sp. BEC1-S18-ESBL-01]|jgi:hypothetical protein|uniref:hypothetical protein n=1 Tax=Acinetobacter TaxID=469 RepID=UPI0002CECA33|nr:MULTISPECIES: hypothetical protein [Acinetobacter]AMO40348.1 hypothetical protein A0J50_06590 [Acinetobacter sp. DUT-2]ENW11739.1 hypothetical protein F930_01694 [Acinetobacter pittii ANC 3678]MCU4472392.1 hypothetical protein [Acinetobacter pittii]MCU4487390.1 hypothetical protein [Acinetobacter pittii]MDR3040230.1 hypothetical protein [Acinetobacter pittii]